MSDEIILDPNFERFAGPLGHVLLEFNYLEADSGRLIARLLRQDDMIASVFVGALGFLEKLKLIKTLASLKVQDADIEKDIRVWLKEATRINELRNRYVHAEYMPHLGPNDEFVEMLHRRLKDSAKTIDTSDGEKLRDLLQPVDDQALKQLATDIHALASRTRILAEKINDWISPRAREPNNAA
jgi:hypothetical protein